MGRHLLIVTGYPGAGKSTTAALIRREFPQFRTMSYDALKEAWFDREGFDGEAEKRRLTDRCLAAFWQQLGAGMGDGGDWLIEYPFCRKHVPMLKQLIEAHGYAPITVVLSGDPAVLWQRFARRDAEPDRHPGHLCSVYHKDGPQVRGRRLSLEEYTRDCAEKDYFIGLGPSFVLDMTDFSRVDQAGLLAFLHEHIDQEEPSSAERSR